MQDIPAVASACWDWLYITVPGMLSFLLNTDQSAKNNRGIEKDNKWLQMDKRSINFLYTGPWLLYRTVTLRGMLDWLLVILEKNMQQAAKVTLFMESYRI